MATIHNNDLIYQLSLSFIPQIGSVQARILIDHFGDAESIFKAKKDALGRLEGMGTVRAASIKSFHNFHKAEDEIRFMEKYKITPFFLTDKNYPQRLLNCYDPPTILYYRGTADLNSSKIIALVGTRNNSEYGRMVTEEFINTLNPLKPLIVSGLAFGIDAIAHKAALKNNLPTVAVLAHGLDCIYPSQHTLLAKNIIRESGGLLTEFSSDTKPDKHNFPSRNRVVAGMCDATIVIETGIKGGSVITADLANAYNRDVFAIPGRTSDLKSEGCNHLIKNNKAILLTDADQLIDIMGWTENKTGVKTRQKLLFIDLTAEEKIIVGILQEKQNASIDEINLKSGLSSSSVAAAILNLEMQSVIYSKPGKIYSLI
jgi:DNA processing protein